MKKNKFIPMNPGLIKPTRESENDSRKVLLSEMPQFLQAKPSEFFGFHAVKHIEAFEYYQYSLGSCVAESGSRHTGILSYKENGVLAKPSVQALMAYIKSRIEKDTAYGASIDSCPKAIRDYGVPLESEFKSDYTLSWKNFVNDKNISELVEFEGTKQCIETYAWADRGLQGYKVGIFFGEGNVVQGGAVGTHEGWAKGNVRPPIKGEKLWGHAVDFFGYDEDHIYFTNSWSRTWGLTLYLKLVENEFGKYYIKGNETNYDIIIKGVGAMDVSYEALDSSNDPVLFKGLTYIDLPDELAQKTKMARTIKTANDNRIYEVLKDENGVDYYIWITSDRAYNAGILNKKWGDWSAVQEVDSIDPSRVLGTFNKEY